MERLGRYRIVRPLGEGGMGRVYEAELEGPAGFRKRVAVKVLKGGAGEGLVREARLGGLLRHPNLVEVYALEQEGDQWFLAMELVEGGSLAGRAPLPPRAVVEVGLQVCAGLQHAHEQIGLVHLDLKPSNLLLDGATVKVADLGIARARGFEADGVRGTPAYMAPEQAAGRECDGRADVWALGLVLHELATGLRGNTGSVDTWSTVEGGVPRARAMSAAPPWLAGVLERCLQPDPRERFGSVGELAAALRQVDVTGASLAQALGRSESDADPTQDRSSGVRTNLGPPPDAFVGRGSERDALAVQVAAHRVVTLKGVGGVGKTRLAREFAWAWHELERRQAWFCDLSEARDVMGAVSAVASVLQVPLGGAEEQALADQVGHALAGRGELLLLLDNTEQLDGAGALVERWAGLAPRARFLVTSRRPLRVRGEHVLEVGPLQAADATELLLARVQARGRTVPIDGALTELATRLDGLPLALELAAGRLGMLSAGQILQRLDQRLDLLQDRRQGAPDRQATLRGMLDGSWEALADHERRALAQLTVFRGGFTLEAAEAVVALDPAAPWVLDVLDQLVERSLVAGQGDGELPRFGLLETVAAYASEHLEGEERAAAEARHRGYFSRLTTPEEDVSTHGIRVAWAASLRELDNLAIAAERARAAGDLAAAVTCLDRAWGVWSRRGPSRAGLAPTQALFEATRGADAAVSVAAAGLWGRVLEHHGRRDDALEVLEAALVLAPDEPTRLDVLIHLSNSLSSAGQLDRSDALREEALALARKRGDRRREAAVLGTLGLGRAKRGRLEEGRSLLDRSLQIHHDLGDHRAQGVALGSLGILQYEQGNVTEALRHFQQALRLIKDTGDRAREAVLLQNVGQAHLELGQIETARQRFTAARNLLRDVGQRQSEATALTSLAALELRANNLDRSRSLLEEAALLSDASGNKVWRAIGLGWLGVLERQEGRSELAVTLLEQAVAGVSGRLTQARGFFLANLGAARFGSDPARGRDELDQAVEVLRGGGYLTDLTRALTLRGSVLGQPADLDEAQALVDRLGLPREAPMARAIREARAPQT